MIVKICMNILILHK